MNSGTTTAHQSLPRSRPLQAGPEAPESKAVTLAHLACHTWPRLQSRRPSAGRCEGQTHAALRAESHPSRREAPSPALPAETPSAERPLQANPPSQSPHCAERHPVSLARGHPLATSAQTQLCTIATTPLTWTSPHVRVRACTHTHTPTYSHTHTGRVAASQPGRRVHVSPGPGPSTTAGSSSPHVSSRLLSVLRGCFSVGSADSSPP